MHTRETVRLELLKFLEKSDRENKFLCALKDLGFQWTCGNVHHMQDDKVFYSIQHKTLANLSVSFVVQNELIVSIISQGDISLFAGINFQEFVSGLKEYLRSKLQAAIDQLEVSTWEQKVIDL